MRGILSKLGEERGQMLVLIALLTTAILGIVGLAIDTGFHYVERRQLQNAADHAALAAAYELKAGGDTADATAVALAYAAANGYDNDGTTNTVTVNSPATTGAFAGEDGSFEVIVRDLNVRTFFIHVLIPSSTQIEGRGVSNFSGHGGGNGPSVPSPVNIPDLDCDDHGAVVDGRVTGDEGYTSVASLISTTTSADYGEAFVACDGSYYYFALRMNGPSTGGGVANENVYAGCKEGKVDVKDGDLEKIKGTIISIGGSSFVVEADGQTFTVDVDGNTTYRGGLNNFGDLAVGRGVEVKVETAYGPDHVLAKEVKGKKDAFCTSESYHTYHSDFNTGWGNGAHTFGKLLGSDRARFQISCDGAPVHDFIQDYLRAVGNDWVSDAAGDGEVIVAGPNQSASSLEFNLENPGITGWGDDPGENVLEHSPPFNPQYPAYDSEYDGFVWEMIYEFRVPVSAYIGCDQITFGLHDFEGSAGGLEGMHSSPAKTADGVFLQVEPFDVRLVE
ncbi:MAG: Tad domain-containing protein [Chloroflexi bacterium]|nr:Tad domain-containing protein [Chloroflexota bacterium]MCH8007675.1 Tad domain-containing protein [Chloroflexota bacterium]